MTTTPDATKSRDALAEGHAAASDGAAMLDAAVVFVRRYVACTPEASNAAALWAVHTHAFEAAEATPRFAVLSAEPQSGKSRFLEVLKLLVREPLLAVSISDAALFRVIQARTPTVLHDEIDAIFGPKARDREDLRALLNAGYERGAAVERCVGEGSKLTTKTFAVFAPVALAGLGWLPDTVAQRSIIVRMKRRRDDESVVRLRRRTVGPEADALRARIAGWAAANLGALTVARPAMPDGLDDRAQDVWEPLVAIADRAGGEWPQRARAAALALFGAQGADDSTIGVRLLGDIREVFGDDDAVSSGVLAGRLATLEGAPWADWTDKGFTAHALAKLLKRYEIRPGQHWADSANLRGYRRTDFDDAFARYLGPLLPEVLGRHELLDPAPAQGLSPNGSQRPNTSGKGADGDPAPRGDDDGPSEAEVGDDEPDWWNR